MLFKITIALFGYYLGEIRNGFGRVSSSGRSYNSGQQQ